jgi:hypothetical protein
MLHACFYTICLVFRYTLWRFYAFSETNLLTRCHSASSLFSAIFVFQKCYTGNILRIGRNKFQNSYFSQKRTKDRTRVGGGARGCPHHEGARPRPWPRPPMVRTPWSPPDDAPSPIRSLPMENPKTIGEISRKVPQLCRRHRQISGDRSLYFGTLPSPSTSPPSLSTLLSPMMRRE